VIASDTETHTYIDNKLLTTEEINEEFAKTDLYGNNIHNVTWARKHVRVEAYAWLISDGRYFACLETFQQFVEFCCQHGVKTIWWYNAKFDFGFIDYQLLTTEWTLCDNTKHMRHKQYNSLHGEQGQRYKLTLSYEYKRSGRDVNRHKQIYTFSNYDFMNFFNGGLAKNLEAFNVVDFENNPIRKLEMDYQAEEIDQNAIQYMRNDVDGLYHLVRIASEFLEVNCGYSLMQENPLIITAGGLAKRVLLRYMYNQDDDRQNVKYFQKIHRMSIELDQQLRHLKLYQGGKTIANTDYLDKWVTSKIYYYDRNSMYPTEMDRMPDLVGGLIKVTPEYVDFYRDHNYQLIYEITDYKFILKDGALPILYDPFIHQYVESMHGIQYNNRTFLMFDFELEEIGEFYDIECDICNVFAIQKIQNDGISQFVRDWYKIKADAKKTKNGVMQAFAKLMLNSSYGKLSQNPSRVVSHREISKETGAVTLIEEDEEADEKSLLSVIMGAYITAKARCSLTAFMRSLCNGAENTRKHIYYCDTDSVQTDIEYKHPDAFKLGGWKLEEGEPFCGGKWLAPKTYTLLMQKASGERYYIIHTKGVATKVLEQYLTKDCTVEDADAIFKKGRLFQTLCGMNVVGGKALLPMQKMLCTPDNVRNVDGQFIMDERY